MSGNSRVPAGASDLRAALLCSVCLICFFGSGTAATGGDLSAMPVAFEADFEDGSLARWQPTDSDAWRIERINGNRALSLFGKSKYRPKVRSPLSINLVKGLRIGSFVLDLRAQSTTRDYPHRDLCIFFGYQDPSHFYYVHMANKTDPNAHSIFIVDGKPRVSIAETRTGGITWGGGWHRVRLVRDAENGLIEVYFDDMTKPIMTARDRRLTWGTIGVGSFDDTGRFDDIRLRSAAGGPGRRAGGRSVVEISRVGELLRVEIGGELFTEYRYREADRPFFYPVIGPTGVNLTRHWPVKDGENEQRDHKHHRSLWFTHGDVNGRDFWSEGRGAKIVQDRIVEISSGKESGHFVTESTWVAKDGRKICTDTRKHVFYSRPDCKMMDFEIALHASHGDLVLGDTKEGSMAVRVAPTMRVRGRVAKGHIVNSEGHRDGKAWGKRARWCDYYGPLGGRTVGIAIFDHPKNPRHPTWWHVREYGLFAANPFGVHHFEKKPKGTGDMKIPAGQSVTFRYRLYFHTGDAEEARVEERYREYAGAR